MKDKEIKIVDIKEENESYSDDDLFNITSWGADLSFRELISMYEEDDLVKPDLQRKYVWTKDEASRFIDSVLLGLPVPSIFLAKSGEQKLIVDGYQRLMTVYDFTRGVFSGDGKVFKLSNSIIINEKWRGKAFAELTSDEQRRVRNTTIHAIIFEQKHPKSDTGMYQIFERINTSGRTLKPQEIRNCVYHGPFNTLLSNLNINTDWRLLFGSQEEDSRMSDIEMIVRFFALKDISARTRAGQKQISLKKYLNEYMGDANKLSKEEYDSMTETFCDTMAFISQNIGKDAFHNLSKTTEKRPVQVFVDKFHPTIFDAISIATSNLIASKKTIDVDDITNRHLILLNNTDFVDAISIRTTNIDKIKSRINIAAKVLYG